MAFDRGRDLPQHVGMTMLTAMPPNGIVRKDRIFVALRKAGRVTQGRTPVYHAVTPYLPPGAVCRRARGRIGVGGAAGQKRDLSGVPPAAGTTAVELFRNAAIVAGSGNPARR